MKEEVALICRHSQKNDIFFKTFFCVQKKGLDFWVKSSEICVLPDYRF